MSVSSSWREYGDKEPCPKIESRRSDCTVTWVQVLSSNPAASGLVPKALQWLSVVGAVTLSAVLVVNAEDSPLVSIRSYTRTIISINHIISPSGTLESTD